MKTLKLIRSGTYKDGGTKVYKFSDGFVCYKDQRMGSKTKGSWYFEYPSDDQKPMKNLPEKYKQLIK